MYCSADSLFARMAMQLHELDLSSSKLHQSILSPFILRFVNILLCFSQLGIITNSDLAFQDPSKHACSVVSVASFGDQVPAKQAAKKEEPEDELMTMLSLLCMIKWSLVVLFLTTLCVLLSVSAQQLIFTYVENFDQRRFLCMGLSLLAILEHVRTFTSRARRYMTKS